jgi:RimJ/RimL family protein N-acetyltransferase
MLKSLGSSAEFPVIETPRLLLRHHRLEDFPACRAMWADPAITQFVDGRPLTEEEAWVKFLRNAGHWPLLGFGFWILEEKSTAAFAGEIGLAYFHRELIPPVENLREAGWILAPAMHGKGYATEAVAAVLAWGDTHFSDPRTICLIHPGNAASIRVAEKCGFREWQRATYRGEPTIIFERNNHFDQTLPL